MASFRKDLDAELAQALTSELHGQSKQTFDKTVETHWHLTQHNFLVNAGGAAAVLAYLGSSLGNKFAIWPLLCFLAGIVASGLEVRALLSIYGALHKDALTRLRGFMNNSTPAEEAVPKQGIANCATAVNYWSGVVSQSSFVLGVVLGVSFYLWYAP